MTIHPTNLMPQAANPGMPVKPPRISTRTVTAATDAIVNADLNSRIVFNRATAIAVSMAGPNTPAPMRTALTRQFLDGWSTEIRNKGAGTVTITPAGVITINDLQSLDIPTGWGGRIWCDGANYHAILGPVSATAAGTAPLASPAFTGTPTAPTAAAGTNTTQLATTAFVAAVKALLDTADGTKAPLANPTFTGVPAAPTAAVGTNTTQIATMAAIQAMRADFLATANAWSLRQTFSAGVTLAGGAAAPSAPNASSTGDRAVLFNSTTFKAAFGIEAGTLFYQATGNANGTAGHKWYTGDAGAAIQAMALDKAGNLAVTGNATLAGLAFSGTSAGAATTVRRKLVSDGFINIPGDFATMQLAMDYAAQNIDGGGRALVFGIAPSATVYLTSVYLQPIPGTRSVLVYGTGSTKQATKLARNPALPAGDNNFIFQAQNPLGCVWTIYNMDLDVSGCPAAISLFHSNVANITDIYWHGTGTGNECVGTTGNCNINLQGNHSIESLGANSIFGYASDNSFLSLEPGFVGTIVGSPTIAKMLWANRHATISTQSATWVNGANCAGQLALATAGGGVDMVFTNGTPPGTQDSNWMAKDAPSWIRKPDQTYV